MGIKHCNNASTWELPSHTEHLHHVETFEAPSEYHSEEHSGFQLPWWSIFMHTHTQYTPMWHPHTDHWCALYILSLVHINVAPHTCTHTHNTPMYDPHTDTLVYHTYCHPQSCLHCTYYLSMMRSTLWVATELIHIVHFRLQWLTKLSAPS